MVEPDESGKITRIPIQTKVSSLSSLIWLDYTVAVIPILHSWRKRGEKRHRARNLGLMRRVLCVPTTTLRLLADVVLAQSKLIILESCVGPRVCSALVYIVSLDLQSKSCKRSDCPPDRWRQMRLNPHGHEISSTDGRLRDLPLCSFLPA